MSGDDSFANRVFQEVDDVESEYLIGGKFKIGTRFGERSILAEEFVLDREEEQNSILLFGGGAEQASVLLFLGYMVCLAQAFIVSHAAYQEGTVNENNLELSQIAYASAGFLAIFSLLGLYSFFTFDEPDSKGWMEYNHQLGLLAMALSSFHGALVLQFWINKSADDFWTVMSGSGVNSTYFMVIDGIAVFGLLISIWGFYHTRLSGRDREAMLMQYKICSLVLLLASGFGLFVSAKLVGAHTIELNWKAYLQFVVSSLAILWTFLSTFATETMLRYGFFPSFVTLAASGYSTWFLLDNPEKSDILLNQARVMAAGALPFALLYLSLGAIWTRRYQTHHEKRWGGNYVVAEPVGLF